MFFELEENLCTRYPALSPFQIRREKIGEFILLVNRVNKKERTKAGAKKGEKVSRDKKGNIHIRREATNDNWY